MTQFLQQLQLQCYVESRHVEYHLFCPHCQALLDALVVDLAVDDV